MIGVLIKRITTGPRIPARPARPARDTSSGAMTSMFRLNWNGSREAATAVGGASCISERCRPMVHADPIHQSAPCRHLQQALTFALAMPH